MVRVRDVRPGASVHIVRAEWTTRRARRANSSDFRAAPPLAAAPCSNACCATARVLRSVTSGSSAYPTAACALHSRPRGPTAPGTWSSSRSSSSAGSPRSSPGPTLAPRTRFALGHPDAPRFRARCARMPSLPRAIAAHRMHHRARNHPQDPPSPRYACRCACATAGARSALGSTVGPLCGRLTQRVRAQRKRSTDRVMGGPGST